MWFKDWRGDPTLNFRNAIELLADKPSVDKKTMSTDYYFVCDDCKEISDNALTQNMGGGYILKEVIHDFLREHFLNSVCRIDGIRIVREQSIEEETYFNKQIAEDNGD